MPFYCFKAFWGEIHRKNFFLEITVTISEKSTEILRKLFFLTMFETDNLEENLALFKQIFFKQTSKRDIY